MPQQYEIWLADLDPRFGSEAGEKRPVVVLQTNLLNHKHLSTIICPITTNVQFGVNIMRVHLLKSEGTVKTDCDIMVDQMRAIDIKRFIHKIGVLPLKKTQQLIENIKIVLDL